MARALKIAAALLAAGCTYLDGSGRSGTASREVSQFDAVVVSGALPLQLSVGPPSVIVSGDDNLLPLLITEVEGHTLYVYTQSGVQLAPKVKLLARVSTPTLTRLDSTGSAASVATGIVGHDFTATVTGSGAVSLAGAVDTLTITSTGSGALDASGLHASRATVTLTGSGSVQLCADQVVRQTVTGSGRVHETCASAAP